MILIVCVMMTGGDEDDSGDGAYGDGGIIAVGGNFTQDVLKHQPMVEKYAKEYNVSEYMVYLLAIIQVESGGTVEDVMQSSESLGLPPNSLSTEESIEQGCKYFSSLVASIKIMTAISALPYRHTIMAVLMSGTWRSGEKYIALSLQRSLQKNIPVVRRSNIITRWPRKGAMTGGIITEICFTST